MISHLTSLDEDAENTLGHDFTEQFHLESSCWSFSNLDVHEDDGTCYGGRCGHDDGINSRVVDYVSCDTYQPSK